MRVGVVGAGTMGAGIAEVFARTPGFDVVLSDTTVELAEKGVARISKGLDKLIAKEKLDEDGKAAILGALSLYLNFINMFMMLLQLFGQRN